MSRDVLMDLGIEGQGLGDYPSIMTLAYAKISIDDMLSPRAAEHVRLFQRETRQALAGRLAGMILFGSRARGDARRSSDFDIAVLVKGLADRAEVDRLLGRLAYDHILKGYHLSPVAIPEDFLDDPSGHPLAMAIRREGIPVT